MQSRGTARNIAYLDPTGTSDPAVQATTSAEGDSLASQFKDALVILEIRYQLQEATQPLVSPPDTDHA